MRDELFKIPLNKKIRVIIDTDAAAEADDQFAIVHACLTSKFDIVGIIAEHYNEVSSNNTMEESYHEIQKVITLMGLKDKVQVFRGASQALMNSHQPNISDGAQLIIDEALREDERPLFILNMGALTNLASAYLMRPSIQNRMVSIWIGGGAYPKGHMDFNLANDIVAARIIVSSQMALWQIPLETYTRMAVSFYEIYDKVSHHGLIGKYLYDKMLSVNEKECKHIMEIPGFKKPDPWEASVFIRTSESWSLGDSAAIGVLISTQGQNYQMIKAREIKDDGTYGDEIGEHRWIKVYHTIDSRVVLEDFFAKLKYQYSIANNSEIAELV